MSNKTSSETKTTKLFVIIPAYNEENSIVKTIFEIKKVGERLAQKNIHLSIVVIDDGSKDKTYELANAAGIQAVVQHRQNRGLGAAVRSGLDAARGFGADIVLKMDADLQHDPNDIILMIQPILDQSADLVYGERFSQLGYSMPLVRRVGNLLFTKFMAYLTNWPIQDSQPGIFALNRNYLERSDIPGDYNYTQQILIDAYLKGMRFAQRPVKFRKRNTGRSFVSLAYPFKVLPQLILVLCLTRPLKFFFPIGSVFLVLGFGVSGFEVVQWLLGVNPKPVVSVNFVLGTTIFGLQTVFFGILAQLIVITRKR